MIDLVSVSYPPAYTVFMIGGREEGVSKSAANALHNIIDVVMVYLV